MKKLAFILLVIFLVVGAPAFVRLIRRPAPSWPPDVLLFGHTTGHGFNFKLRNTYGSTLHYNDGFRLYRQEGGAWELVHTQEGEVNRRLRPNAVRLEFVQFLPPGTRHIGRHPFLPPGEYRFARDLYLRRPVARPHKTLYIEFEIQCPEAFLAEIIQAREGRDSYYFTPLPSAAQGRESYLAFVTAGIPSHRIVQATDVQVSRTAIAFHYGNRSFRVLMYGSTVAVELVHYVGGHWQPVPPVQFVLPLLYGRSIFPGFTRFDVFRFEYRFGELPPGRYMLIREYSRGNRSGARDMEYLMVEFTVTERTPLNLRPTRRISWWNLMGFVRR